MTTTATRQGARAPDRRSASGRLFGAGGPTGRPTVVIIGALLTVAVLTYGVYATRLGYYWDDWPSAWLQRSHAYTISEFFSSDRPLVGWIYTWVFQVMPDTPFAWHVSMVLMHWLSAVALWWAVREVWPRRDRLAFLVASLFLVYPGFTRTPIALTFGFGYLQMATLFASWGLTVRAVREPARRVPYAVAGLVCLAITSVSENFAMLEIVRYALVYLVVSETVADRRGRIRAALRADLPYLVFFFVYSLWRFVIFKPTRPGVGLLALEELKISPIDAIAELIKRVFSTILNTGVLGWLQPFHASALDFSREAVGASVFIGAVTGFIIWKAGSALRDRASADVDAGRGSPADLAREALVTRQLAVVGAIGLVGAGIPAWMTARQAELGNRWDRYTLAGIAVGALLVVAALRSFRSRPTIVLVVLSFLIGASAMFHVQNASVFADDWEAQREVFWELRWRVPSVQPGSTIFLDPGPLIDARDYSMTVETADIFGVPIGPAGEVPFWVYVPMSYERAELPPSGFAERGFTTRDDPTRTMVVVKPPKGCLRVLDPARPELWPANRGAEARAGASDPSRVIDDQPPPDRAPALGPEPEHGWCHAYESLELALSRDDLAASQAIVDRTLAAALTPEVAEEWIPFVETLLRTDRLPAAEPLLAAMRADPGARAALCGFSARLESQPDRVDADARRVVADSCRPG